MRRYSVLSFYVFSVVVFISMTAFFPRADTISAFYDDPELTYTGTWYHGTSCGSGSCYLSTYSSTNNFSSSYSFSFYGYTFSIYDAKHPDSGIANVYVDGVYHGSYDAYSATNLYSVLLYSVSGLSNANHTVSVVNTSTKNSASTGYYLEVDKIAFTWIPPTSTPTVTSTVTITPTFTSTVTKTVTPTVLSSVTPISTFTNTPISSSTPVSTFTNTPIPVVSPTPIVISTPSVVDVQNFVLALPLLFVDWQLSIIWVLALLNVSYTAYLATLPYGGFEFFVVFLAVGVFRRLLFPRSNS